MSQSFGKAARDNFYYIREYSFGRLHYVTVRDAQGKLTVVAFNFAWLFKRATVSIFNAA
jgi:hypothetical protein